MNINKHKYQRPMEPWPSIEPLNKSIHVAKTDVEIFYFESSKRDKPALLMIHGLGDEADTWRHTISAFSDQFRIIAPDLPGFGRSGQPKVKYSPNFFLDSLIGLLDHLEIQQTFVMGNSLGAILAHAIAIEYSERVLGLILVGGSLLQINPMGDFFLRLMQLPFLGEWMYTKLRKNADSAFDSLRNVYHDLDNLPQEDREFLYRRVNQRVWSDGQRYAYFSTLRNLSPWIKEMQPNAKRSLSELETPTLMMRGEFDSLFSKENGNYILGIQKNLKLETIRNAGHLPHQEQPDIFNSMVSDWIMNRFSV